ncbi:MAG: hypothetical protein LBU60_00455 [Clostridiales bacterium]|jgi:hypothetical protein|nr:hypothetical protein [Clostridiales bacterium]
MSNEILELKGILSTNDGITIKKRSKSVIITIDNIKSLVYTKATEIDSFSSRVIDGVLSGGLPSESNPFAGKLCIDLKKRKGLRKFYIIKLKFEYVSKLPSGLIALLKVR